MSEWEKETLDLKKHHGWKATPGYRIFVADRGAMRFNFPQDWVVVPGDDSINFHDKQPPDDDCRLAVSFMKLPPIDWSGLRLFELVQQVLDTDERKVEQTGKTVEEHRGNLDLAWAEVRFVDPIEEREAFSRICLGRESNIQCLITFDFWADDAESLRPVWDEVVRSLELARYVSDPTVGDVIH